MAKHAPLVALCDLPAGRGLRVCAQGLDLALFKVEGDVYAIEDSCPHSGASLSNGRLQGKQVVCPAHGLRFDLVGATCPSASTLATKKYDVQVVDGMVVLSASEQSTLNCKKDNP